MPLTAQEYQTKVHHHLQMIVHYADFCLYHVETMTARPAFETIAQGELAVLENALVAALARVQLARKRYEEKAVEA